MNAYQWLLMVLGLVLGVSLLLYAFWSRRTPTPEPVDVPEPIIAECCGADWGTGDLEGLATVCGEPLTASTIHRVARVQETTENVIGDDGKAEKRVTGGSATIGLFCKEHCPGDCQNPHEGVQSG